MFNGSYSSIEILKIGLESVDLIKSNWNQIDCTLKKKIQLIMKITLKN